MSARQYLLQFVPKLHTALREEYSWRTASLSLCAVASVQDWLADYASEVL